MIIVFRFLKDGSSENAVSTLNNCRLRNVLNPLHDTRFLIPFNRTTAYKIMIKK